MKTTTGLLLIAWLAASCGDAAPAARLPESIRSTLLEADRFEIAALDPYGIDYEQVSAHRGEDLHGYEILSRAEVESGRVRAEILRLFERGLVADVAAPDCFNPRHGILARRGELTVELVICYECLSFLVFADGRFDRRGATTRAPEPGLTAIWAARGCDVPD